jgi:hypothetical protein
MSLRRVGWVVACGLAAVLEVSCGQVYRPVVIPVSQTPPNPSSFHAVFGISTNIPSNPGTALQIDVAGDSNIGQANMGDNPTHAAILPNDSRVFVTAANTVLSDGVTLNPGGVDLVTAFTPAFDSTIASGLGTPTIFTLPNVIPSQSTSIINISEAGTVVTATLSAPLIKAAVGGTIEISNVPVGQYNGAFTVTSVNGAKTVIQFDGTVSGLITATSGTATIPIPLSCSYRPDFVTTAQATSVFVANYGFENDPNCNLASTDSVALLNPSLNSIANISYQPAGSHPVAMVETPDSQNLYVLNQNNTVVDLSPTDLSTLATIPVANSPVWATARVDAQRVYVVTQGDGLLHTIDTSSNTVTSSQFVGGPGANFVLYDKSHNRLYVTNPGNGSSAGAVYVFDAATDPPTPLGSPTGVVNVPAPPPCATPGTCGPVTPVSITALADGSRFYVASFAISTGACPDPNVNANNCLIPQLTVFDAASLTVKPVSSSLSLLAPSISLLGLPQFVGTQYALAVTHPASCAPAAPYTPETNRFRMFTTAAADNSHVYVSVCDAGLIADIIATTSTLGTGGTNTPDQLVGDLSAPFGLCAVTSCGNVVNITAFSISSNVVTFQAVNQFVAGQQVVISGLSTGTYLNGQTLTVIATGLSGTQFECVVNEPNVGTTTDSGAATPLPPAQNPIFLLTGQ